VLPLRIIGTKTTYTDLAGTPIQLDYESIHHHNEDLVGLGDAQLLLHTGTGFSPFRLGGRAGISFPTGKVQDNPFKLGELGLPHEHIEFGTGTFDPILGLDVARDFLGWSLAAFSYTQLPLYQGPKGYQAGARVAGGITGSSSLGLTGPTFRLGVVALHEFPERWGGVVPTEDGNLGRTDLFVGTGVTLPFADDWSLSLDVRGRVWGYVVGAQFNMPLVVEVSIGRLFHLESAPHDAPTPAGADVLDAVVAGELVPLTPVPGKWTLFDFWAPWCEACGLLDGELRRLVASHDNVALRRVNIVDFDSPIARRELPGESLLPHVRLVSPGGAVTVDAAGPADALLRQVEEALAANSSKSIAKVFTCPMHPDVVRREAGACPECGMALIPIGGRP
jgi:hypothetical protein